METTENNKPLETIKADSAMSNDLINSSIIPSSVFDSLLSLANPLTIPSVRNVLLPIPKLSGSSRIIPLPSKLERLSSSRVMHTHIEGNNDNDTEMNSSMPSTMTNSTQILTTSSSSLLLFDDTDSDVSQRTESTKLQKKSLQLSRSSSKRRFSASSLSETDSDSNSHTSDDDSENDTNDDSHSHHSDSSNDTNKSSTSTENNLDDSSSINENNKSDPRKRRCVLSGLKFDSSGDKLTDLRLELIYYLQHPIRIIIVKKRNNNFPLVDIFVHGADIGGIIERKSNISRLYGQFSSPEEKLLMNVTGHHNHTVGQQSNVLTLQGIKRLITLRKCAMNKDYCKWIDEILIVKMIQLKQTENEGTTNNSNHQNNWDTTETESQHQNINNDNANTTSHHQNNQNAANNNPSHLNVTREELNSSSLLTSPIRRAASAGLLSLCNNTNISTRATSAKNNLNSVQPTSPLHLFASICV